MVWRYDEGSVPKKFRLVTTWMGRWTNVRQKKKGLGESKKKGKKVIVERFDCRWGE